MSKLFLLLLVSLRLANNVFLLHAFPLMLLTLLRHTGLVHIIAALKAKRAFIWSQKPWAQLCHICAKAILDGFA